MKMQYTLDVRPARPEDVGAIRRIARASLEASYSSLLATETIDQAVTVWYGDEPFHERLAEPDTTFLLAQVGTELAGFSEVQLEADGAVGAIDWLHVDPHHRCQGIGTTLLEETERALLQEGAMRIEGRVLADNDAGNEFYRARGYTLTGSRRIQVAGSVLEENRYISFPGKERAEGVMEAVECEGETVYVALDEREQGSLAPFYIVYREKAREHEVGFCCANCESLDISMSTMGVLECQSCGNTRKATRWDAAYL